MADSDDASGLNDLVSGIAEAQFCVFSLRDSEQPIPSGWVGWQTVEPAYPGLLSRLASQRIAFSQYFSAALGTSPAVLANPSTV